MYVVRNTVHNPRKYAEINTKQHPLNHSIAAKRRDVRKSQSTTARSFLLKYKVKRKSIIACSSFLTVTVWVICNLEQGLCCRPSPIDILQLITCCCRSATGRRAASAVYIADIAKSTSSAATPTFQSRQFSRIIGRPTTCKVFQPRSLLYRRDFVIKESNAVMKIIARDQFCARMP